MRKLWNLVYLLPSHKILNIKLIIIERLILKYNTYFIDINQG